MAINSVFHGVSLLIIIKRICVHVYIILLWVIFLKWRRLFKILRKSQIRSLQSPPPSVTALSKLILTCYMISDYAVSYHSLISIYMFVPHYWQNTWDLGVRLPAWVDLPEWLLHVLFLVLWVMPSSAVCFCQDGAQTSCSLFNLSVGPELEASPSFRYYSILFSAPLFLAAFDLREKFFYVIF